MLLAVRISSYECTWEVWRTLKKLELLSDAPRATLALLSCSPNLSSAFITRYTQAKHEPILKYTLNKKLENYKILGRLSSYVASYHYSYLKPLHYPRRVCPAHAILTLGVYQDSRSWRSTSIFSDLALYLLFICNERNVFLLFILLLPRITDFPYSEYFFQVTVLITQTFISHETTLPRTLKRLMTVSYVGLYSSTDGNL